MLAAGDGCWQQPVVFCSFTFQQKDGLSVLWQLTARLQGSVYTIQGISVLLMAEAKAVTKVLIALMRI